MEPRNGILLDEQFLPAVQRLLSAAKKQIWISTFKAEITSKPRGRKLKKIFETLFEKTKAGVDVRFITNEVTPRGHIPLSNIYAIRELKRNNVKVYCPKDNRVCHSKLILVDKMAVVIGSHNLSVKSCHNNLEVSILSADVSIVSAITLSFEFMWEFAKKL